MNDRPGLVVCGGMPRSGSTWLYNVVRVWCEAAGLAVSGYWIDDWNAQGRPVPQGALLLKLHQLSPVVAKADLVLTTRRDVRDAVRSAARMGWVTSQEQALRFAVTAVKLHEAWAPYSDFELVYEQMVADRVSAVAAVGQVLDRRLGIGDVRPEEVAASVDALKPPADSGKSYDPISLLHPRHIGGMEGGAVAVPEEWLIRVEKQLEPWLQKYGYL